VAVCLLETGRCLAAALPVPPVDKLAAERHPGEGLADAVFTFVNGLPSPTQPGGFTFGGRHNRCTRCEFSSAAFTGHVAQDEVIAHGGQTTVDFRPFRTVVRFSQRKPHYWAVPLINFVSHFGDVSPDLQNHPLRTRRTDELESLEGDLAIYHEAAYRRATTSSHSSVKRNSGSSSRYRTTTLALTASVSRR
jgi:hypothetical protein